MFRAGAARWTGGLSPYAIASAWLDWAIHLSASPGRQLDLWSAGLATLAKLAHFNASCAGGAQVDEPFAPRTGDHRFDDAAWHRSPACAVAQSYLAV
ncbi:MAG: poly-beta-hydroxybutyrate polymerase N-terminal domain-containing protein, partial [Proteobacteria bacterium]|nr:poly-beta-hydroxybutyrate polymerase N-terminal domain-containing protein [Pseudomonadota bacterium]